MDMRELTSRIGESFSVRRAFGAAYEKNGLLVIPVALVAGGGGGGQRALSPEVADGRRASNAGGDAERRLDSDVRSEAGGGFGGLIMPVGAYVVNGDQVRWVPAVNVTVIVLAGLSTIRLLALLRARGRRRRRV